ncbi:hypothetical protein [Ferrimonas sp. SCSIO 43195]|uniref:hypothetical protein n=1 Tax=Ferrimonas sp. SCSIO 43195 TaxID=2822844 RepID=UPI002075295D|nr:hypothetical protein [Ferrimonas sp. SCSIO 43195]USD36073.1 hypothetical protein J8Z22_13620 [Ferrimonas sp. SCSIO 43195]
MKLIQFSGQYGGGDSSKKIAPLQRELNAIFFGNTKDGAGRCFDSLEHLSIIFRVSGPVRDFGFDGPERLKKVRDKAIYTIDFTIPEDRWINASNAELRLFLVEGIRDCFDILYKKIESKEKNKLSLIQNSFDQGVDAFLKNNLKI